MKATHLLRVALLVLAGGMGPLAAQTERNFTLRPINTEFSAAIRELGFERPERALAHLDKAWELVETDEDRILILRHRAALRSRLGQHQGAVADVETWRELAPAVHTDRGWLDTACNVYRDAGNLIAASAVFRDLTALGPDDPANPRPWHIAQLMREARILRAWGDLGGALERFDAAEQILGETVSNVDQIAAYERERAACRLGLNDLDTARKLARDALSSDLRRVRSSRRRPVSDWVRKADLPAALSLILYAEADRRRGELDDAEEHFKAALEIAAKLNVPREQVRARFGLIRIAIARGDILSARLLLVGAMLLTQEGAIPDLHIETLALVGEVSLKEGDPAAAIGPLNLGIEDVEEMRLLASPEDRQRLIALQAEHYRWLTECYVRTDQLWEALAASEALKARGLRDALSPTATNAIESIDTRVAQLRQVQERLPTDIAIVSYANADWSRTDPIAFVLTHDDLQVVRLPLEVLPDFLNLLPQDDILAAQQKDVDATRYDISNEISLAGLVAYFRSTIYCEPQDMQRLIEHYIMTGKVLHYTLVAPLMEALGGRTRLLVSPSGLLAYVPFDALVTMEGNMLVQTHALSLTPSVLTTLDLAERAPATYTRPFLGFGGAVYNPASYNQVMASAPQIKTELAAVTAVRSAQVNGARSPYAGFARGPATNLAGTQAEVELLSELLPGSRIVTGRDVSEGYIRGMADRGELSEARVLHFAVHGSAVPTMPELSCILLSWEGEITPDMPAERDGRLQITEFEQLPLRCELVTFSACETGLGAIIAGEGVVGLTGSLLQAGADNVLASLWPVSDYSTVYFMRRYYELHLNEGMPSDLAIAQVKRDMLAGKLQGYRHPQYWAPFNLYGGRELVVTE